MDLNGCPSPRKKSSNSALVIAQVQAFLDAAEDVDIDPETVEDLLGTFAEHQTVDENTEVQDDAYPDSDDDSYADKRDLDVLDISALFNNQDADKWTKQEIGHLLKHLKEHGKQLKYRRIQFSDIRSQGMSSFIQKYVLERKIPIPKLLLAFGVNLCPELQAKRASTLLYFLRVILSHQLRLRDRLPQYNAIEDAIHLIRNSQRVVILTGAGISVSCGIPDFRSKDGIYASLKANGAYDLDDPQQMFDISYFRENPFVFYSFASKIYPSNFVPSPCHRFIKLVEDKGKLLRNYTQNIDTLETLAGVQRVLQCHGSFATASCLQCRRRVQGAEIEVDIMRHRVPLCTVCNVPTPSTSSTRGKKPKKKKKDKWDSDVEEESDIPDYPPGIMKPDITFFGEKLTDDFDRSLEADRESVDLLLVIGTSLKVAPVADILTHLPHSVPQILINKTPIRHINPDIILLGNADDIIMHLCSKLGWELPPEEEPAPAQGSTRPYPSRNNVKKRSRSLLTEDQKPQRVGNSHVWLFPGAEGGRWLQEFQEKIAQETETETANGDASRPAEAPTTEVNDGQMSKKKQRTQ
ncbi:hypothetical protein AX14_000936 [Amanita brunnescens Koide BX004]|nr:hypothetical protein AX14_000936 [Amanita brunnescens Koide BX004]